MSWFISALKKYAVFKGRASRKEFWLFILFYIIFGFVASVIDRLIGFTPYRSDMMYGMNFGIVYMLYFLATIVPFIAVTIRRLHDTNRSGFWIVLYFLSMILPVVPIIGFILGLIALIYLLVLLCLEGTPGPNNYGPDPREEVAVE